MFVAEQMMVVELGLADIQIDAVLGGGILWIQRTHRAHLIAQHIVGKIAHVQGFPVFGRQFGRVGGIERRPGRGIFDRVGQGNQLAVNTEPWQACLKFVIKLTICQTFFLQKKRDSINLPCLVNWAACQS